MGSRARKRPRAIRNKNRADCPFTVTSVAARSSEEGNHVTKKRKRDDTNNNRRELVQKSPFKPHGKFKTHQTMDMSYSVEPRKQWFDMTRYKSFVLNKFKYYCEDFVYVANDTTIERQKATNDDPERQDLLQLTDYWVAKILEIRALDEHHVYARVYWMYSPDELPPNNSENKKLLEGLESSYGQNELIASNHMDVINVISVVRRAVVNQWVESDDIQVQDTLYWRRAFDCRTSQLSSVDETSKCKNSLKSEASTVKVGTEEEPQAALLSMIPAKGKIEGTRSPLRATGGKNDDNVLTKQMNGNTPRTTETLLRATEDTEGLSANNSCPNTVEGNSHGGFVETTLKMTVKPAVPQMQGLEPKVSDVSRASARDHPLSSTCAGSVPMPSASEDPASTLSTLRVPTKVPSIFPVYLPSKPEHELLVHLQHALEVTCYDFGKRAMPNTLQRRGWDCAESVELNRWTEEFLRRQKIFPASEHVKKPLDELFRSIANIRHNAVHRRRVSMKGIEQFLLDAETLALLLGDARRSRKIAMLRQETHAAMKELERNKHFLHSRLDETLREIAAQRAELQHIEEMTIAEMERQDKEYGAIAGESVQDTITASMARFSTIISTEESVARLDNADGRHKN